MIGCVVTNANLTQLGFGMRMAVLQMFGRLHTV